VLTIYLSGTNVIAHV